MPKHYRVEHLGRNVLAVHVDLTEGGSEQWFLLRSDVHHDNAYCDRAMETRHLKEAKERGAGIIDNGDLFCAMQGKYDRRADKSQLRDEHKATDYLGAILGDAADTLGPYADNIVLLGHGNHETSVLDKNGFDLTSGLCSVLNDRHGTDIRCHGFSGWVMFRLHRGRAQRTFNLFRHHGYGGGAPVTKGVIQSNRLAVWLPDAHIVLTGHDHNEWMVPLSRMRLSDAGKVYHDEQVHVRVPGYKDGVQDGYEGWEVVKGFSPRTTGAAWLRFYRRSDENGQPKMEFEVTRAR